MLRLALVGIGDAGRHHARALGAVSRDRAATWTAIVGRDRSRADVFRAAAKVPPDVASFASLEELLDARGCDAVILATPDAVHGCQVALAASRGIHVLVEKPFASTTDEGKRVLDVVRRAGVRLAVGYQLRHHAGHRVVKSRLAELIGDVRQIDVRWAWPDPAIAGWRATGTEARFWALAALGTHAIDLALWLGGGSPKRVSAILEPPHGIEKAAEVSLILDNGVLAHVSVAVTHRALPRVVVTGDRGAIEALGTLGARGGGTIAVRGPRLEDEVRPIPFDVVDPYEAQLRDFIDFTGTGSADDDALIANLDVLDRVALAKLATDPR